MAESPGQHSSSASANNNTTRLFPPYLLWFVLIPALPFFFSTATLSFFIEPAQSPHEQPVQELTSPKNKDQAQHANKKTRQTPTASDSNAPTDKPAAGYEDSFVWQLFNIEIDYIKPPHKTLTLLSNLLTYFSTTAVHGIVCLIVIGFFLYQIHRLPLVIIKRTYLYIAITAVSFFILAYIVHLFANNLILTQLGYKSICMLLGKAELQTTLVWPDPTGAHTGVACFRPEFTRLVWLAYTPIALGMLAIVVATAFTTVLASQSLSSDDTQWRQHFLSRTKLLQKSFYLSSLVLVTSTVTILFFTTLPLELLKDAGLAGALEKFFNGLTAFWGGLFTATLFATFTPAVLLFIKHALNHQRSPAAPTGLGQWLYETVFVSIKKQAMNVLVIIAPMLVGPFSELLRNLSSLTG